MESSISTRHKSIGFPLECISPLGVDHRQYHRRYLKDLPRLFVKKEDDVMIHTIRVSGNNERMVLLPF